MIFDDDVKDPDWKLPKETDSDQNEFEDTPLINEPNEINSMSVQESQDYTLYTNKSKLMKRRNVSNSLKQIHKKRRMKGDKYLGINKNEHDIKTHSVERSSRIRCPSSCSKRCEKQSKCRNCRLIDEETRMEIFEKFWKRMEWKEKKLYVVNLVEKSECAQRKTSGSSRRKFSYRYYLWKGHDRICVCKNMFTSTLGVSEKTILNWLTDVTSGLPKPQTTNRYSATSARTTAKEFLESLPKVPSHYFRTSTSKLYLEPLFTSLSDVYREYCSQCAINGQQPYNSTGFNEVFREINFALWQPKKDQCDICCSYETGNGDEALYQLHIKRKVEARESKAKDKEEAKIDDSLKVFTLDLQSLLLCPKLQASSLYYKTKLSCHNFTVYDLVTGDVTCYFWNEAEGDLSANSFSSCVIGYLNSLDLQCLKRVIIYSDGCGYQNRNSILSNALLLFAVKHNIEVEQKYLEKEHTQMECDSIHSTIERRIKKKPVYVPHNYVELIREARIAPGPYTVKYLDHSFFKDYASLNYYPSIRLAIGTGSATVADIRVLKYTPDGKIMRKISYGDNFQDVPKARSARSRTPCREDTVDQLYQSRLKIKKTKCEHLQQIKTVLPSDYHSFYDLLPHQ